MAAGGAGHPRDESVDLVRAGSDPERVERQARIPNPAVAVIPVAAAADRLRERCRRGGDDRPGGSVGQPLEDA